MDRRRLLKLGALGAGTTALSGCLDQVPGLNGDGQEAGGEPVTPQGRSIEATEATRTLHQRGLADPYIGVEPTGNVVELDLWTTGGTIEPLEGEEIGGIGFSTSADEAAPIPGPEIRLTQGDRLRVHLHSDFHTIHWHGMDVPWKMDGVPFITQDLATENEGDPAVYTYDFVARQAGTYWYHCGVHFPVHKDLGMFGPLVIEAQEPELPYDRDETLIFHELDSQYTYSSQVVGGALGGNVNAPSEERLAENPVDAVDSAKRQARHNADASGSFAEGATGVETWSEGPRDYYPASSLRYKPSYDTFMINGKSYPETEPVKIREGETLRLRLINAGELPRAVHLHGHHMLVTHRDGYPLSSPEWRDVVTMSSGQHADVYVQGTNPGIWNLHDHAGAAGVGAFEANDYAFPGGMRTHLVYEGFEPPDQPPKPETDRAGDLAVYAPSYRDR